MSVLYVKLVLTAVFWGGTFVAGRLLAAEVPPFSAAFLRFTVASLCLFLYMGRIFKSFPRVDKRQAILVLLLGATGIFSYNALFFSGLKLVPAGRASLIIACNPVFLAILSALIFRDRLRWLNVGGIALSLLGAATVITRGDLISGFGTHFGRGELFILGCVASWIAYTLIGKVALKSLTPLVSVSYACLTGTVLLIPPALHEGVLHIVTTCSWTAWLSVLYLGIFGTVLGFIWFYDGVAAIGPARAGVFINLVPVSSILMANLMLGESVDHSLLAGGLLVIVGVTLTNRRTPAGITPRSDTSARASS